MKKHELMWRLFGKKRPGHKGIRCHRDQIEGQRGRRCREVIRRFQALHYGRLPNLSLIPTGEYCYASREGQSVENARRCPYWSFVMVSVGEVEQHPGLVALDQTRVGACSLLGLTDDELGGYGLLWDEIKECPFP